jgi:sec-independent protein translocase protein TatC
MPEIVAEPEEKQEESRMGSMGLLQHLEELRKRIIRSMLAVAGGACIGWWFAQDKIYPLMAKPLIDVYTKNGIKDASGAIQHLTFLNPLTPFNTYLKVGLVAGIFLACPFVLYQVWMFISPGLYRREKRFLLPFLFLSVGLFLTGGYFGYRVVFPIAMDFLISTYGKGLTPNITIDEYTKVFLTMILGLAVIFELPIVIGFAAMMGVVNAKFLIKHIRGAVLVFFIIAAVLSPTTDIVNMAIYAAPMILLYILSIGLAWFVHPKTRRKRKEKREGKV